MYVLGNGVYYVTSKKKDKNNKKVLNISKELAIQFNTKEDAATMLNSLVKLRKKHPDLTIIDLGETLDTKKVSNTTTTNDGNTLPNFEDRNSSNDVMYKSIVSFSKKLIKKLNKKDKLEQEQATYDRMVIDYVHKIELNNLSKKEIYELYDEMRSMLLKRRKVKDELNEINSIASNINFNKIDKLLKYYENREVRSYTNRELDGYIGN